MLLTGERIPCTCIVLLVALRHKALLYNHNALVWEYGAHIALAPLCEALYTRRDGAFCVTRNGWFAKTHIPMATSVPVSPDSTSELAAIAFYSQLRDPRRVTSNTSDVPVLNTLLLLCQHFQSPAALFHTVCLHWCTHFTSWACERLNGKVLDYGQGICIIWYLREFHTRHYFSIDCKGGLSIRETFPVSTQQTSPYVWNRSQYYRPMPKPRPKLLLNNWIHLSCGMTPVYLSSFTMNTFVLWYDPCIFIIIHYEYICLVVWPLYIYHHSLWIHLSCGMTPVYLSSFTMNTFVLWYDPCIFIIIHYEYICLVVWPLYIYHHSHSVESNKTISKIMSYVSILKYPTQIYDLEFGQEVNVKLLSFLAYYRRTLFSSCSWMVFWCYKIEVYICSPA